MKCSYCGQMLRDNAQFCSNCGHSTEVTTDENASSKRNESGVYFISLFSLMIVLALAVYGCYSIIRKDMAGNGAVSYSDSGGNGFNYSAVRSDPALVGKWSCTDRAAADYSEKNFGVEVSIILTMTDEGKFTLNYSMTDTGIPALTLTTSGDYSTESGTVTFVPEETESAANYLKKHGRRPAFRYTAEEDRFTLKYENGKDIVFNRIAE